MAASLKLFGDILMFLRQLTNGKTNEDAKEFQNFSKTNVTRHNKARKSRAKSKSIISDDHFKPHSQKKYGIYSRGFPLIWVLKYLHDHDLLVKQTHSNSLQAQKSAFFTYSKKKALCFQRHSYP